MPIRLWLAYGLRGESASPEMPPSGRPVIAGKRASGGKLYWPISVSDRIAAGTSGGLAVGRSPTHALAAAERTAKRVKAMTAVTRVTVGSLLLETRPRARHARSIGVSPVAA